MTGAVSKRKLTERDSLGSYVIIQALPFEWLADGR